MPAKSTRSCQQTADSLKECLRQTECMKSGKYSMAECAEQGECAPLYHAYVRCRQSLLDGRARIRGIKGQ